MAEAIAVFARAPIPGQTKTRLALGLGATAAAELYLAMLRDTLESATEAARKDCDVILYFTPVDAFDPGPYSLDFWQGRRLPQSEGDLGQKLLHCLNSLRSQGYDRIVVVGSDSPDLSPTLIDAAFAHLDAPHCDLVFGPAHDGGFYLMAVKDEINDALFEAVEWSSQRTLEQILSNATRLGLSVAQLPAWGDIDTLEDLQRLIARAKDGHSPPPHTAQWLKLKNLL